MKHTIQKFLAMVLSLLMLLQSMPLALAGTVSSGEESETTFYTVSFLNSDGTVELTKLVESGTPFSAVCPEGKWQTKDGKEVKNNPKITENATFYRALDTNSGKGTVGVFVNGVFRGIGTVEVTPIVHYVYSNDLKKLSFSGYTLPSNADGWSSSTALKENDKAKLSTDLNLYWKLNSYKQNKPCYIFPTDQPFYTVTFRWMDDNGQQVATEIVQGGATAQNKVPAAAEISAPGYRMTWPGIDTTPINDENVSFEGVKQVQVHFEVEAEQGAPIPQVEDIWLDVGGTLTMPEITPPEGKIISYMVDGTETTLDALQGKTINEPLTVTVVFADDPYLISIQQDGQDVETISATLESRDATGDHFSPETIQLTVHSEQLVEGATVVWSSSDPEIVKVDETGLVTPVKHEDNTPVTITAKLMPTDGDVPLSEASVTYTSVMAKNLLKITFDKNGGTGEAPGPFYAKKNSNIILPSYEGSKGNEVFSGWSSSDAANGQDKYKTVSIYPVGSEYYVTQSRTLYATWSVQNVDAKFFIRLDGQIPTEPQGHDPSEYTTNAIKIGGAIKVGTFYTDSTYPGVSDRLNTVPNDDQIKAVYSNYDPNTQYVLWYVIKHEEAWHVDGVLLDKAKVNLSYNANAPAGTWSNMPDGTQYAKGGTATVSDKIPTRTGYTFIDWTTAADGTGTHYKGNDTFKINEDTTLYAHWEPNGNTPYTVEFYYQQLNGTYPSTADDTVERYGKTDFPASVKPEDKTPPAGYTYDEGAGNVESAKINGDGSTVLKLHFKRRTDLSYTVHYYWNGTTTPVYDSKPVENKTLGETVTEQPIEVGGYTLVPESEQPKSLTISGNEDKNVIIFNYYKNVELTAKDDTHVYNGEEQTVSVGFTSTDENADFTNAGITASGAGKDADTYQTTFAYDTVGKVDANSKYIVTATYPGKLTITPRPVTLTSATASKDYDGTALTNDTVTVGGDGFVTGEGATYNVTGSQLDVGSSENTFTYTLKEGTKASNYTIAPAYGTLTVDPVYQVRYFQDSVDVVEGPGKLLGTTEYLSLNGNTAVTLNNQMLNAHQPDGYLPGEQQGDVPAQVPEGENVLVIDVLYLPGTYAYTIRFYELLADGEKGEQLKEDQKLSGELGKEVNAGDHAYTTFPGFTYNDEKSNKPITIGTDESKNVITLYYTRNSYNVIYKYYDDSVITSVSLPEGGSFPYKSNVTVAKPLEAAGYTFDGWYQENGTLADAASFSMPAGDVTLLGKFTANTDTAYKVEHYKQNVARNGFDLVEADTELKKGTTGADAVYGAKEYEGFTFDNTRTTWEAAGIEASTEALTIAPNGSLLIKLYYTRDSYELTVRYWYRTGDTISSAEDEAPTFKGIYDFDAPYKVDSPSITGWTASASTVSGNMPDEPTVIDVYYTQNTWTLTVRYRYLNGTEARPDSVTNGLVYGASYDVPSPAIAGYTASPARVTGTMPDGNHQVTVFYTAIPTPPDDDTPNVLLAAAPVLVPINEYGIPLGFANTVMNLGDCFE